MSNYKLSVGQLDLVQLSLSSVLTEGFLHTQLRAVTTTCYLLQCQSRVKHPPELQPPWEKWRCYPRAMLRTWGGPRGREIHVDPDTLPSGLLFLLHKPVVQHGLPVLLLRARGQLGLFPVPLCSFLPSQTLPLASTPLPAKLSWFSFSSLPSSKGMVKWGSAACGKDGHVTRALRRCFWTRAEPPHDEAYVTLTLAFADFWWLNCATETFLWINTNQKCLTWQT